MYSSFSASVTYVAQIDDDVLPDVEDGGELLDLLCDVDLYGMKTPGASATGACS